MIVQHCQCYLLPEPGAEEAVDDEVGRGVDDEEDVGDEPDKEEEEEDETRRKRRRRGGDEEDVQDEPEEDYPDGETSKHRAATDFDLLQELLFPRKYLGVDYKI